PDLPGHTGPVYSLAFSASGAELLSASNGDVVRLWEVGSGKELRRFVRKAPADGGRPRRSGGLNLLGRLGQEALVCAFAPDGKAVAAVWPEGPIHLWDGQSGKLVGRLPTPVGQQCLDFSPDGLLASAGEDGVVRLWDARPGKQVKRWTFRPPAGKDRP